MIKTFAQYAKEHRQRCKEQKLCQRCGKQDDRTLKGFTVCAECTEKQKNKPYNNDKQAKSVANARYRAKRKALPPTKKWFIDNKISYTPQELIDKCLNCTKPECDDCIGRGAVD